MINYLIPFERIGEFKIHNNFLVYKNDFDFRYTPADKSTGWETYEIKDEGISLYVEDNIITSIVCDLECLFKGRNIIGMEIDEFINFSELVPAKEIDTYWISDNERQDIYEFEDIGLQVWCKNDKIVTIIASAYIEDEEE